MRLLTTLCVAAFVAPSIASANELSRLYGLALENDQQLRAAAAQRDATLEAQPITRGALLPQVNAQGNYVTQDQKFTQKGFPTTKNKGTAQSYGANLSQALLDRASWYRWRQAGDTAALAEVRYHAAEQDLVVRAALTYFNLLAAADSVHLANAQSEALDHQLELAKKRFEVGLSAVTDVQETQARYDLAAAQKIAADQQLSSARIVMENLSGTQDIRVVPLKEDFGMAGPIPASAEAWRQAATEGNLDLKAAELLAESADKDIGIATSGHWPTLAAVAGYSKNTGSVQESEVTQYGVQVNVPIFAGGASQARVNAAKFTHEQRVAELEYTRRATDSNTLIAFQAVLSSIAQVKAQKQAVLSNTTALEASQVGLEVGSRTTVDVLNAQSLQFSAEQTYARSRYDYLLNVLRLKAVAGQLMAKDLNEIDALLGFEAAPAK